MSVTLTAPFPAAPAKPRQPTAGQLFRGHRPQMLATYMLICLENLLRICQPAVLGLAINDLMNQSYRGLAVFGVQHLAFMLIAAFRQVYEARVFTDVDNRLEFDRVQQQRPQRLATTAVADQPATSVRELELLNQQLPLLIRCCSSVCGALLMLAIYDARLLLWCAALLVPTLLLNLFHLRQTMILQRGLQQQELSVARLGGVRPGGLHLGGVQRSQLNLLRQHLQSIAGWKIRLSDAAAIRFSLMQLFVMGLMVGTLVQFCLPGPQLPGDVFAVVCYVLLFVSGLENLPQVITKLRQSQSVPLAHADTSRPGPL